MNGRVQVDAFPPVTFTEVNPLVANECLLAWGHKMGPLERGNNGNAHYALLHHGRPVALASHSTLIREAVGGDHGLPLSRENCLELSRLCAERPGLCRVVLRIWREFVFPTLGYQYAISYQDADLHTGNTYRFDGWRRISYSRSCVDQRSGRRGRNKWVWLCERQA